MKFLKTVFFFFAFFIINTIFAQGYEIKIKIKGYEAKSAKLGFHYGNKQYVKDSSVVDADGWLTFKGEKELEPGIYILIMKPKNVYFDILVNRGEQKFTIETVLDDIVDKMKVTGSPENENYYKYLNDMGEKRENVQKMKDLNKSKLAADFEKGKKEIEKAEKDNELFQDNFIKKYPTSFAAKIIKASRDVTLPEFVGTDKEIQIKRYFWYKEHFFDNYDMNDERMVRTPMLFSRVDYYVQKLTSQQPDSIINSVDRVLKLCKNAPETFKFYCTHYLNFYAKSEIIGQDAVYVYLAKNYYEKGLANWVPKDQVDKIIKNANDLAPTLLGQTAQDFVLTMRDKSKVRLYDIKSPYTIVMFWAPDCGHCKEEMPDVIKFWNKWKTKGVYLLGVCNRYDEDKIPECWQFMDERPEMKFPVGCDEHLQSNTQSNYYVRSTPMVFILDKDKKIVMKKINPKELDNVMDEIIRVDQENLKIELDKNKK